MFKAKDYAHIFNKITDSSKQFPDEAFELLKNLDLSEHIFSDRSNVKLNGNKTSQSLLDLLFEVGRGNLSVGRIYEGHINALLLIDTYGNSLQKQEYFKDATEGKLFGVWNTENPVEGLQIKKNIKLRNFRIKRESKLKGAKKFCSGATNIQRPIVTVKTKNGPKMLVLELEKYPQLNEDWSFWNPIGMRPSVSCRLDFSDLPIDENQFLGVVGDYYREPTFSWGAVRFSTVQLGGARAIIDVVVEHLKKLNRTDDPYQKMRLGKMKILMETGELWINKANKFENSDSSLYNSKILVNFSNMMRTVTTDICEEIIILAEKAVGIQGMMIGHPLERIIRDLRVYLKQAGPDSALASVGEFIANQK